MRAAPGEITIAVVASLLLGTAATAAAQPSATPPTESVDEPLPEQPLLASPPQRDEVSPGLALGLSLGSTAAAWSVLGMVAASNLDNELRDDIIVVCAVGTLLAPSVGHWYARRAGWQGLLARGIGAGLVTWGVTAFAPTPLCESCERDRDLPLVALAVGLGTYAVATVYDIVEAPGAARRQNARSRGLPVMPMIGRAPSGAASVGLGLAGQF